MLLNLLQNGDLDYTQRLQKYQDKDLETTNSASDEEEQRTQ